MNNEAIELAERNIKSAENSLAKAREQLAEAKAPPAFRNGDFGFHEGDSPRIFLRLKDGTISAFSEDGECANSRIQPGEIRMYNITGNIFDQMKKK